MMASFKFIQKLWILNSKILEKIKNNSEVAEGEELTKFTNQLIHRVTQNLEKFHYNVIVANLYEMYNFLIKEVEKPIKKEVLVENYRKILIIMSPFIPHFTSECLAYLDKKDARWPIVSGEDLIQEEINFVIQINAKKRAILVVKRDLKENEILDEIKSNVSTAKLLKDQKVKKIIFVSNKLINIII